MSEAMWMDAVELIGTELEEGDITREEAVTRWVRMGLDRDEAEEHADAAEANV